MLILVLTSDSHVFALQGKIKQTMDKAFWDGIMENEAGEKRPCITFFQRHGWSIMKFIPYGTVYVGICVVYNLICNIGVGN